MGDWKDKIEIVWFGAVKFALWNLSLGSVVVDEGHGGIKSEEARSVELQD